MTLYVRSLQQTTLSFSSPIDDSEFHLDQRSDKVLPLWVAQLPGFGRLWADEKVLVATDAAFAAVITSIPPGELPGGGGLTVSSGSQAVLPEYVYVASGSSDNTGIAAVFNAMKVNGKATGQLTLIGNIQLSTPLILDGGYANVGNAPAGGVGENFRLKTIGSITLSAGATLTVRGMYAPELDIRLQGGGSRRRVTDAAMSSASNQTQLTSATANFTAADVGRYVRVEGASTAGEAPLIARIVSRTSATIVVLDKAAKHTVSAAACVVGDIGLYLTDIIDHTLRFYGNSYLGMGWYVDDQLTYATAVRQGSYYSTTEGCGQGWFIRADEGDFGKIHHCFDMSTDGLVIADSADTIIGYLSIFEAATQNYGLIADNCFGLHWGKVELGDRATGALAKIVGGNVGIWDELYLTRFNAGAGLELVDCATGTITALHSNNTTNPLHIRGSDVRVLSFWSEGSDTTPLLIEAGNTNTTCNVEVMFDASFVLGSLAQIAASITGGNVKVNGQCRAWNQGSLVSNMVNCLSTGVILDVRGLKDYDQAAGAFSVAMPAFAQYGNLVVTDADRTFLKLQDVPTNLANLQPAGQVASPVSGTSYPNNTHRTIEFQLQVVMFGDATTPGNFTFTRTPPGGSAAGCGATYSGGVANQTVQATQTFTVPPGWSWSYTNVNSAKGALQQSYWRYV